MADSQVANVLLSTFPGLALPATLSFSLPVSSTVAELIDRISDFLPESLPLQALSLTTTGNKQVFSSANGLVSLLDAAAAAATHGFKGGRERERPCTLLPLRLSVPLRGGKGGFGSQLRAAGGRMSSKRKRNQGENNGSSRNLDGRRLRTVNEAKALAEYLAVKPEMDKKNKEERRRRWQAVVEAAEKRQEELKSGGGTRHKIDGQWMEDKEEMNERAREAVLQAMKDGLCTDNLRDVVLGGSSSSASANSEEDDSARASSSASDSESEADADDDDDNSREHRMQNAPRSTAASHRRFAGFDDDDDEFMSDSDADDAGATEMAAGKGKGRA